MSSFSLADWVSTDTPTEHCDLHMQDVLVRSLSNATSDRVLNEPRVLIDPEVLLKCNVKCADVLYELLRHQDVDTPQGDSSNQELGLQVIMILFLCALPSVAVGTHISAQDHPATTPRLSTGDYGLRPHWMQPSPTETHTTTRGPFIRRVQRLFFINRLHLPLL